METLQLSTELHVVVPFGPAGVQVRAPLRVAIRARLAAAGDRPVVVSHIHRRERRAAAIRRLTRVRDTEQISPAVIRVRASQHVRARKAEHAVYDQRSGDDAGDRQRVTVDRGVPDAPLPNRVLWAILDGPIGIHIRQRGCAVLVACRVAEPSVDGNPVIRHPRQLAVVLSVVRVVFVRRVVVGLKSRQCRRNQLGEDRLRNRADAVRRDVIAGVESRIGRRCDAAIGKGKRDSARAVRTASPRIVNDGIRAGEIPLAHRHRRHIAKTVRPEFDNAVPAVVRWRVASTLPK